MAPSRPQRPPKGQSNTNGTNPNGVTSSRPIGASGASVTSGPVNTLPPVKPDGVPRDPRYRAAKAAWKVSRIDWDAAHAEVGAVRLHPLKLIPAFIHV